MKRALNPSDSNDNAPSGFWESVSFELFSNVRSLYESIDTFFSLRSPEDGFPAMFVFCVYICGSCASYLWKWPQLCPTLSLEAEKILMRSLEVLQNLQHAWPMASKWLSALQKVAVPHRSKKHKPLSAMASQERFLSSVDGLLKTQGATEADVDEYGEEEPDESVQDQQRQPPRQQQRQQQRQHTSHGTDNLGILSDAAALATQQQMDIGHGYTFPDDPNVFLSPVESIGAIPSDNFDTELSDFLQENVHLGMMEAW